MEISLSRQSTAVVLTTKNNETKHYIYLKHTREIEKAVLANKTIYTLIWYAFYDLQPGNGAGPILTDPESTQGNDTLSVTIRVHIVRSTMTQSMSDNSVQILKQCSTHKTHTLTNCSNGVWTRFNVGPKVNCTAGVVAEPHQGLSSLS